MGSRRRDNNQTRSLHCRGYDTVRVGERELREVFSVFGKVIDVYLPKDYFTKKVRGFAYIQFENEDEADKARVKLDRTDIFKDDNVVNIMWAAGERKTPIDMRRLDIERDNPHARRAREREGGDRDWRSRDRSRDRPDNERYAPPRGRSDLPHRDRFANRSRPYGFGAGPGARMGSRSPPAPPRDRAYVRRYDETEDRRPMGRRRPDRSSDRYREYRPDYSHKRARSRTPSFDAHDRRRRRRSSSKSPPHVRRRSVTPPRALVGPHGVAPTGVNSRERVIVSRSRSVSPIRSKSPLAASVAGPSANGERWRERDVGRGREFGRDDQTGRVVERVGGPPFVDAGNEEGANKIRSVAAPKQRNTPSSPFQTTLPSPDNH